MPINVERPENSDLGALQALLVWLHDQEKLTSPTLKEALYRVERVQEELSRLRSVGASRA